MTDTMLLPPGKSCADCVHFPRCVALIGAEWINSKSKRCDFAPSRFFAANQKPPCARCDNSGKIANTPGGEPWPQWEALPEAKKLAATVGIVAPVACPECCGGGL